MSLTRSSPQAQAGACSPDARVGAGDVPEDADRWEALLSSTHLPWSVRVPERERGAVYRAVVRRQWIDDLALVDCECDPCAGARGRRQIAATEGDHLVVLINRGGSETVSQGGQEAVLRPGDAVAWDSRKAARFTVWEPLVERSLLIPRPVLSEAGCDLAGGVHLDRGSPAVQLLGSYLDTLSAALPLLGGSAVTAARNATLELVRGALQPGTALDPGRTGPPGVMPSSASSTVASSDATSRWRRSRPRMGCRSARTATGDVPAPRRRSPSGSARVALVHQGVAPVHAATGRAPQTRPHRPRREPRHAAPGR